MSCFRRRRKQSSGCESMSDSSSDEDDCNGCPKKRKLNYIEKCGPLRSGIDKILNRINKVFCCMNPQNWSCVAVALFWATLFLLFAYFYGMTILRFILPENWLKSTGQIVKEAIARYDADRLARADYALESAGGSVLCSSDTYSSKSGAFYSLFGIALWYHSSSPRMVIQPNVAPGNCWAMDGTKGFVTLQLAMPVIVTAVSIEHIPKEVSPLGRLDSAMKELAIFGKEQTLDSPEVFLGKFRFEAGKDRIQVFDIRDPYCQSSKNIFDFKKCGFNTKAFSIITVKVLDNHGNPDYTCIYRIRVHGEPYFRSP